MYPTVWANLNIFPKCLQQKFVESDAELSDSQDAGPALVDGVDVEEQNVPPVPKASNVGYDHKQNDNPIIYVDPKDEKIGFLTSTVASMQSTLMMLVEQQLKGNVNHPQSEKKRKKGRRNRVRLFVRRRDRGSKCCAKLLTWCMKVMTIIPLLTLVRKPRRNTQLTLRK